MPYSAEKLPDDFARTLFKISSPLPQPFRKAASSLGLNTDEGAHGLTHKFRREVGSFSRFPLLL
jgi:hypothetical protein